ncbi:MAG: DUF2878 domain-containing protein [Bdellovibrionales bacterium]
MNYAARTMLSWFSFNLGWWACAIGAGHGYTWLGPALMPLFVGAHLYFSPVPKGESIFLAVIGVSGFAIDTVLLRLGLFAITPEVIYPPLWLVAIWIFYGQTYESMLMMRRNKLLLYASGALSGPLSYYCFEALHLMAYARPLWLSITGHALLWGILTPVFFVVRDWTLHLTGFVPSVLVTADLPQGDSLPVDLKADRLQPEKSAAANLGPRVLEFPPAKPSDPDKF